MCIFYSMFNLEHSNKTYYAELKQHLQWQYGTTKTTNFFTCKIIFPLSDYT